MGERCYSTLVCAERDKDIFEKMGYRLEESKALSADGKEIPGAVEMVDEQANYGHYDELAALTGIPFPACRSSCPGAYGDHLIVSDGKQWHHSEALHEQLSGCTGGIRWRDPCLGNRGCKEILGSLFDGSGLD